MPVKYQGGTPKKIYHGSDLVEAIFYGGTQIWPTHPNLPAVTGAYALSGKVAVLRRARKLIAAAGTFVRSGQPANFVRTRVMSALAAVFALSGQAVVLIAGRPFLGEVGTFTLAGQAVLRRSRTFAAAAGSCTLSGQPANLVYSGGVAYSFNMTAADYFGFVQGFSDGGLFDAFGSIDAEPIPGHDCVALYYASAFSAVICFEGDVTAMLAGRTAWIDGVEYPFTQDWQYGEEDGNYTIAEWDTGKPVFVAGSSYFVEIK